MKLRPGTNHDNRAYAGVGLSSFERFHDSLAYARAQGFDRGDCRW